MGWKIAEASLWWICLVVLAMIVETIIGDYPLWAMVSVVVASGAAAMAITFRREIRGSVWMDDRAAVQANPGNGPRVARLMLKAAKVDELDALHGDFKAVAHRTEETKVEAAYWWKRAQIQGSDTEEYWEKFMETFYDAGTKRVDAILSEISRLEEAHEKPKSGLGGPR